MTNSTKELLSNLRERVLVLLFAAAAIAVFHYYAGLRFQASLVLGVSSTIVVLCLRELWKLATFRPYKIDIGIKFDALREDLGLIATNEKSFENFSFTAINAALFARSDEYQYSSTLAIYGRIPSATPELNSFVANSSEWKFLSENRSVHPKFFFRPARYGYEFGIRVVPEWWSEHRKTLSDRIRSLDASSYDEAIVLAFLPYGYIPDYVRRGNEPVSLFSTGERWLKNLRRWQTKLVKHGWTTTEDYPHHVDHRYLAISYQDL
jgi:hypothetical protein